MYQNRKAGLAPTCTSVIDLNFLPVELSSEVIEVFEAAYSGDMEYEKLQTRLSADWSVWRNIISGNDVYLWSSTSDSVPPGLKVSLKKILVNENPALVSKIILDAFEREFIRIGFTPLGYKSKFFVNFKKGNLLSDCDITIDSRVGIYPKILIDSFFTSFNRYKCIYGLVTDVRTLVQLDVPVSELVKKGLDCRGLYIIFKDPDNLRPDLAEFNNCLVGRFNGISSGKTELSDLKDIRLQGVDPSMLKVEPKWENLWLYIDAVYHTKAADVKQRVYENLSRFNSPKRKWEFIEGIKAKFMDSGKPRRIKANRDLTIWLTSQYQARHDSEAFRFTHMRVPVFSHDYASRKTSNWADGGLRERGPYDRETFSKKDLRVLVVSPAEHKGQVEQFIKQFEDGFIGSQAKIYNGFLNKYHLQSVKFEDKYFTPLGNDLAKNYEQTCLDALSNNINYELCFLIIREAFEALPTLKNPYYVGKALVLSQGIPVQEVHIETIQKPLNTLPYVLNNIGLACYAKLGGTPFVLRAEEVVRKELVIGIGHAIDRDTRLSYGKPVIGFTTVFKNNGDFLLSGCTPFCDFSSYEDKLEDVIVSSVEKVAEREGYRDGEELRIIFHVFKKTGRRENQAVQKALERLKKYKIEYALLHVNDSHLFHMFDKTNNIGIPSDYIAPRGVAIELGPRERLINLIGPKQYLGKGCPTPLRLTIDQCSTFKDINYLCQQLFEFSFMSWRGFNPAIAPATILYSKWIAQLNSKLRKIPNWNQHILSTQLADKRWFL